MTQTQKLALFTSIGLLSGFFLGTFYEQSRFQYRLGLQIGIATAVADILKGQLSVTKD